MQVRTVDPEGAGGPAPRPGGRRRPRKIMLMVLTLSVALLAAAATVTYVGLHRSGGQLDAFHRALAGQAQSILENSPVIANLGVAAHIHDPNTPNRVMCAVDVFGTEPADATEATQVHVVYAQHLCAMAPTGTPWDYAPKSAGPVVVDLDNGTVWVPQPNQDYRTQVKAKIPERYQQQAFGTFRHPDVVGSLRQRYNTQMSAPTS